MRVAGGHARGRRKGRRGQSLWSRYARCAQCAIAACAQLPLGAAAVRGGALPLVAHCRSAAQTLLAGGDGVEARDPVDALSAALACVSGHTEIKERSLLNDDPKWLDTPYVLANYKTEQCKKPPRLCRSVS